MKHSIKTPLLLLTVAGSIALYSCKEDKENTPPPDAAALLMTGSWKLVGYTVNPALDADKDGDTETDLFEIYPDCRKDDTYTFINNYIVKVDNGAGKCSADESQVKEWMWDLSADEKRMMYDGSEYTIEELNTTTFRLKRMSYQASTDEVHAIELIYQH